MAKKIIIYGVNWYFGGPLVLAALCKTFRDLGYDARIMFTYAYQSNPKSKEGCREYAMKHLIKQWLAYHIHRIFKHIHFLDAYLLKETPLTTMPGIKIQYNPFFNRNNTIVIYPECQYGNPLKAKYVMRWLLFHYMFEDDSKAYEKNDFFVCFRKYFNSPNLNPKEIMLQVNYFDNTLYRQYNFGPRKGKCYILRKGKNRKDLPKHFDGPVYDNDLTQEELVKMFNEYEYCYSYDTQTFYSTIAVVCGCKTVVVMEPGKTVDDYLSKDEKNHYGIAYGDSPEQLEYAEKTRHLKLESLNYAPSNEASVKRFLPYLEEKFGEIKRIDV